MKPTLLVTLFVLFSALATGVPAKTIKKCKDAQGRWHYGDTAAEACERSKIIEMTTRGAKKGETAAPPTKEELADLERRKKEIEEKKRLAEEQAKKDRLLLSTYGHEKDIIYVRDRKLARLESSIKASEETLKSLRATQARVEKQAAAEQRGGKKLSKDTALNLERIQAQVSRHEAAIAQKRQEQELIKEKYEAELKRYRELKRRQLSEQAAKPAAAAK